MMVVGPDRASLAYHERPDTFRYLYVERWLKAPMQRPDGTLVHRVKCTPQGSLCAAAHNAP